MTIAIKAGTGVEARFQAVCDNPDDANTLRAITQTNAPVLLIHSRNDEFIPWQQSQRLHEAAPDHSRLILVEGSSHFDIWQTSFDVIRPQALAWFRTNLTKEQTNREGDLAD